MSRKFDPVYAGAVVQSVAEEEGRAILRLPGKNMVIIPAVWTQDGTVRPADLVGAEVRGITADFAALVFFVHLRLPSGQQSWAIGKAVLDGE